MIGVPPPGKCRAALRWARRRGRDPTLRPGGWVARIASTRPDLLRPAWPPARAVDDDASRTRELPSTAPAAVPVVALVGVMVVVASSDTPRMRHVVRLHPYPPRMDWGDPAWYSLLVSLIALALSVPSALLAWKSLNWERDSANSARRSAEAAERANLLTERALAERALTERDDDSKVTDYHVWAPTPTTGDVSWRIEHPGGSRYILRNTGTAIAEHVSVDAEQVGGVTRSLPSDAVIRPGEGVDFLVLETWGNPAPNQLYIRWDDMQDFIAVPMP